MRKWLAPIAALAFIGIAGTATADEVIGKVKELNEAAGELILEDGQRFGLMGAKYEGVAVGDTVKVEFADVEGALEATVVVKVEG